MSEEKKSSVFTSQPFKFIVDGEAVFAHPALISQCSKPLDRLMKGGWSESSHGAAVIEGTDASTFNRFLEWIYCGHYTIPSLIEESIDIEPIQEDSPPRDQYTPNNTLFADEEPEPALAPDPDEGWGNPPRLNKVSKKSKKGTYQVNNFVTCHDACKKAFSDYSYEDSDPIQGVQIVLGNKDEVKNFSDILLCHVRLYVFADERDIQRLKQTAFEALHESLKNTPLRKETTKDIVTLLRYVYEKTKEPETGGLSRKEPLREMLTKYIGSEMDLLIYDENFRSLMIEYGGPLFDDFMEMVGKRI